MITARHRTRRYPSLTSAEIDDFVRSHSWKFARTMLQCPHSYLVLDRARDPHEFQRLAATIRRRGYEERYGRKTYTCMDVATEDGTSKLWTMPGDPTGAVTIINRTLKQGTTPGAFLLALSRSASIVAGQAEQAGHLEQAYRIRLAVTAAFTGDWSYVQSMAAQLELVTETPSIN